MKKYLIATLFFLIAFATVLYFPRKPSSQTNPNQADSNPADLYQSLENDKPISSLLNFILVEDFNDGKFKERKGATWRIKEPVPGAVELSLVKRDGRNPNRGYSLRAFMNLKAGEQVAFQSFLNLLDVSQAQFLVFKLRLAVRELDPFHGNIQVGLTDSKHKTQAIDLPSEVFSHQGVWQEVVLPIESFSELDLDTIFSIKFIIEAGENDVRGNVWLDEIAFYGPKDVGFLSNRDNLIGFPNQVWDTRRREKLLKIKDDAALIKQIAKDTWKYFENAKDKDTHLIVDHIRPGEAPLAAAYTSPTNIAMDFLSTIGAMDLGFIKEEEAQKRTKDILNSLIKMRKYKGFFYNFYDTKRLEITRSYISSVDSGWLAIALVIVRQAFGGEIADRATRLLDDFNFDEFIDPENFQMVIGFEVPVRNFGGYHYGMLASEARATSLYAIGKGDVSSEHWWFLYRTPPSAWEWQNQKPQGKMKTEEGIDYIQGYYEYRGKKFIPSWGGSLFEYLMPTIVLKEQGLAPKGLGMNDRVVTELQRDYALIEKKYPVWGISPSAIINGRGWQYGEYGVKALSAKGYPDKGIITPHVSFLALDSLPKDAILNIRKLLEYEIYGPYGLYDTLNVQRNEVNPQYLALDQGMSFVAMVNYLTKGSIKERFHKDVVGKNIEKLLSSEDFFN